MTLKEIMMKNTSMQVPSKRVLDVSECYQRVASFKLFARLQGYANTRTAYVAICRFRSQWPELFPNRVSKNSKKLYSEEIAFAWRESKTAAEAASRCGYTSVSAFKMRISRLRSEFGEESFPLKRASCHKTIKNIHMIDSRVKAASILWRANAATIDIASCLDMTNAELSKFIDEYRRINGLALFPYRGLVIR
jgi:hypothetical protein